jgi:predicted short-subunit dehydrogenase-like oxidoreductase (DUF2520 family)
MDVSVVGAGRVGTAVAVLLRRAGHRIVAVSGRTATRERVARFLPGVPVLGAGASAARADLTLNAVPDDAIAGAVAEIVSGDGVRPGAWVAHVSGASGLDVLEPVVEAGGRRLSVHPLQAFADVDGAIERLPGSAAAVTADDEEGFGLGERLARDLGARPFRLADAMRPRYHAAAVIASNDLVVLSSVAERLFRDAGVPDPAAAMLPLQRATLDNVERLGTTDALTGPAVRGDAHTIERNLTALAEVAPAAVPAYVALGQIALELATAGGRLDPDARAQVEAVLARWT